MAAAANNSPLPPCERCGTTDEVTKIGFPSRQSEDYHCNSCGFYFNPALPAEGDRARLRRGVERFPHFYAEPGFEGTVTEATKDSITLRMDDELPGAGEWDNEIVWTPEDGHGSGLAMVASIFFEDAEIVVGPMKVDHRIAPADLDDVAAVERWFEALLDAGINFHPEDRFGEIVFARSSGNRVFSQEDADRLDRLMDRAAELCDPCGVALRVFEKKTGRLG